MSKPPEYRLDSVCGLYCGACDVFLANQENRVAAAAKAWGMKVEQLICHGCNSHVHAIYCVDCEMKECAASKGVEHCADCDRAPCEKTISFQKDRHAHHSLILENQRQWREIGSAKWLRTQASRWCCPDCGTPSAWYDRTCRTCERTLFDCTAEEKTLSDGDRRGKAGQR